MELKDAVHQNFTKIRTLFLGILISMLSLVFRIKLTHNFYLLFLGWNLILALIPFAMTLYLYKSPEVLASNWKRIGISAIWLLFLPNSPYIITDFIHLQNSTGNLLLFDFILITSFATTGFLAGLYSMQMMLTFYQLFHSARTLKLLTLLLCAMTGFGVYLGRFARLNSWDIFIQPISTYIRILDCLSHPMAWAITISLGSFLLAPLWRFINRPEKIK